MQILSFLFLQIYNKFQEINVLWVYNAFGHIITKNDHRNEFAQFHSYMTTYFCFSFKLRRLQQYYRENKRFYIKWKSKMNI